MEKSNQKARQNNAATHMAKAGPLFCRATALLPDVDILLIVKAPL